ncbi:MAG: patatin-like phospholipase family protein, partial [Chloroflexi bacterium]|nr:patatin-like phospholipase family protein [Chloroflexota bacterium]
MALPNFLQQIKSAIDHEYKRNLYRNLVFKGGGVRGIAYMGALEILDEYRIVENIECVAGTSAGAIAAALTSLRLSISDTKILFNSLDLKKIPQ